MVETNLFKKIIDKKVSAHVVYEDSLCLAFRDIHPQAPVHLLLIPKKEISSMAQVDIRDRDLLGHLMWVASQVANTQGLSEEGYRLVVNTNQRGGQTVNHLHIHILGGRDFSWPPG